MASRHPASPDELFPTIYGELRRVAGRYLRRERRNHTLQPTALVHEAWLRLQQQRGVELQGRTHGLALGAQAMRRLLIDHGRHQKSDKRGGGARPVSFDNLVKAAETAAVPVEDLLTLEAALSRLFRSGCQNEHVEPDLQVRLPLTPSPAVVKGPRRPHEDCQCVRGRGRGHDLHRSRACP